MMLNAMMRKSGTLALMCLFAFLGGAAMQGVLHTSVGEAWAASMGLRLANINKPESGTLVHSYVDANGVNRFDLGVYNNTALQNLYADDGSLRAQIGIYTAAQEKGLPFIGLSDNRSQLRMLFRLAGNNESPVIVFKDKTGKDRMVMGLGMNSASQEPFLAYFDSTGARRMVFGEY